MASKTTDAIKLVLRLPKGLHKRLKQQARRNNVSLNTEIVNQLEGSDAATARRMATAMKPLVEEAIKMAVMRVTGRPSAHELILDALNPSTEAELLERLERSEVLKEEAAEIMAAFRDRQAAKEQEKK
jgi:Arc-like DNA binding domain